MSIWTWYVSVGQHIGRERPPEISRWPRSICFLDDFFPLQLADKGGILLQAANPETQPQP